jgi:hypothetical protein
MCMQIGATGEGDMMGPLSRPLPSTEAAAAQLPRIFLSTCPFTLNSFLTLFLRNVRVEVLLRLKCY